MSEMNTIQWQEIELMRNATRLNAKNFRCLFCLCRVLLYCQLHDYQVPDLDCWMKIWMETANLRSEAVK